MAIYNIFDYYEKETPETVYSHQGPKIDPEAFLSHQIDENFIPKLNSSRDKIFSALAARFFFFLLLIADLAWGAYSALLFLIKVVLCIVSLGASSIIKKSCGKSWLNVKRSIVCAIALFIAIFSPALGIMFSCMYFLMYDKSGVEEVVPASLRDQFREIFPI